MFYKPRREVSVKTTTCMLWKWSKLLKINKQWLIKCQKLKTFWWQISGLSNVWDEDYPALILADVITGEVDKSIVMIVKG